MSEGVFNERSLREAIVSMWGEHGAHVDVFDAILTAAPTRPTREQLRELVLDWKDKQKNADDQAFMAGATPNGDRWTSQSKALEHCWKALDDLLAGEGTVPQPEFTTLHFRLEEDTLDGGWVAQCVEEPGCISQGDTVPEALVNVGDAYEAVKAVEKAERIEREAFGE